MENHVPGHASLVELIKASYLLFDVGAIGLLRLVGEQMAKRHNDTETLEETVIYIDDGIFVQEKCPFSTTIASYNKSFGNLPQELSILADHANQQGAAWASAFCGIHQAYRRARFGKDFRHIACRSGGEISFVDLQEIPEQKISLLLEQNVCVFMRQPTKQK